MQQPPRRSELYSKRIYIDTSVWLRFLTSATADASTLAPDVLAGHEFFKDLQAGKFTGIVSSYVETEYIGALKVMIAGKTGASRTATEMLQERDELRNAFDSFGVEQNDAGVLVDEALGGFGKLHEKQQEVLLGSECAHRGLPFPGNQKWCGVSSGDAIHAVVARLLDSSFIATADYGFRGLSVAGVTPAVIHDVYQ